MSVLSSENLWQTEVSYVAEGSYAIEHFPVIVSDEFSFIFYNHPSNRNSEQFYSVARLENESGTIVLNKELEFTGSWVDADLTRSGEVIFAYAPKTISSSTYTTIGIFDEDLDLETYSTFGASEVSPKLLKRIEWWKHYTSINDSTMDNNPAPGNKRGGLTTILEKSLGAVAKGGNSRFDLRALFKKSISNLTPGIPGFFSTNTFLVVIGRGGSWKSSTRLNTCSHRTNAT